MDRKEFRELLCDFLRDCEADCVVTDGRPAIQIRGNVWLDNKVLLTIPLTPKPEGEQR